MPTLKDAIALAAHARRGQVYTSPAGVPFILHPLHVMLRLESEVEHIVAVLHDIVEDTSYTIADRHEASYKDSVLAAIEHLTHREDEAYDNYRVRVAQNPIARRVKLADFCDNITNNRQLNLLKPSQKHVSASCATSTPNADSMHSFRTSISRDEIIVRRPISTKVTND